MSFPQAGAPDVLEAIFEKHKENILSAVRGEEVFEANLWLAVGYFVYGAGSPRKEELGLTRDEWLEMLMRTGRDPNLIEILSQLEWKEEKETVN